MTTMNRRTNCASSTGAGGFTLIELMIVVAIFALVAVMALVTLGRSRAQTSDLDRFAKAISSDVTIARRRAVATQRIFLVDVEPSSVSYCQVTSTTQTTCPSPGLESSAVTNVGHDVTAVNWRQAADIGVVAVNTLPAAGSLPAQVYLMPNGTADTNPSTPAPDGFTIYLQDAVNSLSKRKIVVNALEGRPRITDSW